MPNYRRAHVPGGTFFFTVKTERNAPIFRRNHAVGILGNVIRETKLLWPFEINAIALLPDHLHSIWSLPPGDADFSKRRGWLKKEFTKRFPSRRLATLIVSPLGEKKCLRFELGSAQEDPERVSKSHHNFGE